MNIQAANERSCFHQILLLQSILQMWSPGPEATWIPDSPLRLGLKVGGCVL